MFNLSSRMNLPTRLSGFTALALVGAVALPTPASAAKWIKRLCWAVCKQT